MYTVSNLPWTRVKGPRTKRRRLNYNKLQKIPRALTSDSLIKLKTAFDIPGRIYVTNANDSQPFVASSLYRPLKIKSMTETPATEHAPNHWIANEYEWNDGVVTGNLSHYLQPPTESKSENNTSRAAVSNIMMNGNQLWGGGMIGYEWSPNYSQFSVRVPQDADTSDINQLTLRNPVVNVKGTKQLHLHSYSLHLKETPWVQMHTFNGQPGIDGDVSQAAGHGARDEEDWNPLPTANLFRSYPLATADRITGVPFSHISGDASVAGTSNMELKQMLHTQARIKVRNLLIRLPPEAYNNAAASSMGTHTLQLNALLKENAAAQTGGNKQPWQTIVWEAIKDDFMLVGDHKYDSPDKLGNKALYARINPKYTVLQETYTTLGMSPNVGGCPKARYHHISHAFQTKYGTDHSVQTAPIGFAKQDIEDNDLSIVSISQFAGKSTANQMTLTPQRIEMRAATGAFRGPKRDVPDVPVTDPADEGVAARPNKRHASDLDDEWKAGPNSSTTGIVSMIANNTAGSSYAPNVLVPMQNRLVWIRIPRMADSSIELSDLVAGNKNYPVGHIVQDAQHGYYRQMSKNLLLSALTQLCSVVQGNATYKFLNPSVMGRGECVPPLLVDKVDSTQTSASNKEGGAAMEIGS